jgi:hypothetical protein
MTLPPRGVDGQPTMGFRKFRIGGLPPPSSGSARTVSTLRYLAVAMFGALLVVMAYGLYYFPAAPIRYVDGQYVDKRGGVHTRSDYERLRVGSECLSARGLPRRSAQRRTNLPSVVVCERHNYRNHRPFIGNGRTSGLSVRNAC